MAGVLKPVPHCDNALWDECWLGESPYNSMRCHVLREGKLFAEDPMANR